MLKLGALIVLAVLLTAQGPIPTPMPSQPPVKSQGAKTEPQPNQARGVTEQRGTEKTPVVVSLKTAPDHKVERAEDRADSKEQTVTEKNLADYTWYLVLATIALGLVALLQAFLFFFGLKDTAKAANAAAKQSELTRRQYIAANRPRLRVRLIRIDAPISGQRITVRYEVVNVGGTKATIIDNEITIRVDFVVNGQPTSAIETRQFHFANELRQGEALPATEQVLVFDPEWGLGDGAWWGARLFVIGTIRYLDDNGVMRRTAFYRVATDDLNRFIKPNFEPTTAADHEYED